MIQRNLLTPQPEVEYPEDDGLPMSENTLQFQWIVTIKGNLDALFGGEPNVFVAGDLLWYPVEGDNTTRQAPDTFVAFGRPKGYRGSYRQWEESGVAPQVVFEILSPGNRPGELSRKFAFYERHGVEEYYIYDPHRVLLTIFVRIGAVLQAVAAVDGWVSPRLGVRFDLSGPELVLYHPDGRRFATFEELDQQRGAAVREAADAKRQAEDAKRQAADAQRQAEAAVRLAEKLAARLQALGVDAEAE